MSDKGGIHTLDIISGVEGCETTYECPVDKPCRVCEWRNSLESE